MIIKNMLLMIVLILTLSSCGNKKYEDYSPDDFYEVQGTITRVKRTSSTFDSYMMSNMNYMFYGVSDKYIDGFEPNIDIIIKIGQPVVILVHKEDENINFYGYKGIIDEPILYESYIELKRRLNTKK